MLPTKNLLTLSIASVFMLNSFTLYAASAANANALINEETVEGEEDESLEDFYGDDDFVSIATGTKQLIHKAPSTASVITAEDIVKMGAVDLDEVLESVPGLHVSYRPGNHLPIYTFRGIYSPFNPQVLMLINGVPITNIFVGNRNQIWGGMTLESVARIEVVRGPGSAVYGADALAGVINVITKSGKSRKGSEIGVRAGSFSTKDYWFTHTWQKDELNGFISYERHQTDGFQQYIDIDAQTFLDSVFGTNASLAPGFADHHRKNDELRVNLNYNQLTLNAGYQKRKIGVGLGIGEALGPGTNETSERWNFDANYIAENLIENWGVTAKFSYFSTTQEIDDNLFIFPAGADIGFGAPFPDGVIGNPEVFEKHYRTSLVAKNDSILDHDLTISIGYDIADLYKVKESKNFAFGPTGEFLFPGSPVVDVTDTPFVFLPEDDRTNKYIYIQDVWSVAKDWQLTAGIRRDDYSDFGATTNPRLALVWTTNLNLTTKFLYGRAFRAPSFAEMRNINNPVALGNANLQPEIIDSYEIVFNYHPYSGINYGISLFNYDWQDIIKFSPDDGATTKTAKNIGEQKAYGFEFEFTWTLSNAFNLSGNYSWVNAEDNAKNTVSSIPQKQLYLLVNYNVIDSINVNIKSNWIMDRARSMDDLRTPISDYNLTDFTLKWQPIEQNFALSLIIKNIFDTDAREPTANKGAIVNLPHDLPLPGRTTLVQIKYDF